MPPSWALEVSVNGISAHGSSSRHTEKLWLTGAGDGLAVDRRVDRVVRGAANLRNLLGDCPRLLPSCRDSSDVARVSNEPLSILLFTLPIWIGHRIVTRAPNIGSAMAMLPALGLIVQVHRPAALSLVSIYGFFWLGQLYNVLLLYLTKGLAGSMGWYMHAVMGSEVVLCAVSFGRFRAWVV